MTGIKLLYTIYIIFSDCIHSETKTMSSTKFLISKIIYFPFNIQIMSLKNFYICYQPYNNFHEFENVLVFYIKYDCPSISILFICLHRRIYFLCITFDLLFHLSFWIHHRQRVVSQCRCTLIKTKLYKIDPVGNRKIWNIMIQTQFSLIGYRLDSMKFQKPCKFFSI